MYERRRHTLSLLLCWAIVGASSRARAEACGKDSDCSGDNVCEGGQCAPPGGAPPASSPPRAPARAVPALQTSAIEFEGSEGEFVKLEGPPGKADCKIPCSLQMPAGTYRFRAKGFKTDVEIPDHAATVRFKRSCGGCYVTGGVFLGLSIPFYASGAVMSDDRDLEKVGTAFIVAGVLHMTLGLSLIVVGIATGKTKVVVEGGLKNSAFHLTGNGVALSF